MKKIISLFKRDYEVTRLVYDEVVKGAEWVQAGEGTATRKWDGTACLVKDGKLYKRYDCKKGRVPPPGFRPCEPERDPITGHWPGWVPVGDGPEDKYHREAFVGCALCNATFELLGPKVQGNPEDFKFHWLARHGAEIIYDCPHTFEELKEWFKERNIEGIVWHHPDGRMVKIKKRDFGLTR